MTRHVSDVRRISLSSADLDPATVVTGRPAVRTDVFGDVGGAEVGLWEITPGVVTDVEGDEVFVVLSGSGEVVLLDSGERLDLGPGTMVRLHAGERTEWRVTETIRKVYVAG